MGALNLEEFDTEETNVLNLDDFDNQPKSVETNQMTSNEDEPFSSGALNLNDFPETSVRSTSEQTVEDIKPDETEKPDSFLGSMYGSLVETPAAFLTGATMWPIAQAARHGAVGGQWIQEKLGFVPEMTAQEKEEMGDEVDQYISSLGTFQPKTQTGKSNVAMLGKIIEPVSKFSNWATGIIDEKEYPNLHNLAATGVEFGVFAAIPKVAKGAYRLANKGVEISKMHGAKKIAAEKALVEEQKAMLDELNKDVGEGKYDRELDIIKQQERAQTAATEANKAGVQKQRDMKAQLDKISEDAKANYPERNKEFFDQESSQAAVDTPKLEPIEKVKRRVEPVTEEGLPRNEYQIDPDTGKINSTYTATERKVYKIINGKPTLVESVPAQKSVWQIITEPLKNEGGFIDIEPIKKGFEKAPSGEELYKKLIEAHIPIRSIMKSGMSKYLTKLGENPVDWKSVKSFANKIEDKKIFSAIPMAEIASSSNIPPQFQSMFGKSINQFKPEVITEATKVIDPAGRKAVLDFNNANPEMQLKYDGIWDASAAGKGLKLQLTPTNGKFTGRTFLADHVSVEGLQNGLNKLLENNNETTIDFNNKGKGILKTLIAPLMNETGSINIGEMSRIFGKSPKGQSLLSRLKKKGVSHDDLKLSGIEAYLNRIGSRKVDFKDFKKQIDENSFDIEKTTLSDLKGTEYGPEYNPEYNLLKHTPGTYTENLYKFDPNIRSTDLSNKMKVVKDKYQEMKTALLAKNSELNPDDAFGIISKTKAFKELTKERDKIAKEIRNEVKKNNSYTESHWYEEGKNVMAHRRSHERYVEGKDTLYVDEVQSKWHDKGKRDGYKDNKSDKKIIEDIAKQAKVKTVYNPDGSLTVKSRKQITDYLFNKGDSNGLNKLDKAITGFFTSVPNAPMKNNWHQMVMRDVIGEAIAKGKEGISWSTGNIQAKRWQGAKTDYNTLYDKKIKKFMEKEAGAKAIQMKTEIGKDNAYQMQEIFDLNGGPSDWYVYDKDGNAVFHNKDVNKATEFMNEKQSSAPTTENVWYIPITKKLRSLYPDGKVGDLIDTIMAPLRNETGSIRVPFGEKFQQKLNPELRDSIRELGKKAEADGKSMKDYLISRGVDSSTIRATLKLHQMAKEERPMKAGLETPKALNGDFEFFKLKDGEQQVNLGKDANQKIKVSSSDAEVIMSSPQGRKGLTNFFKPSEFMFDRYPKLRNLLDQSREIEATITNELKTEAKHVEGIEKIYPKKKLREEAGAWWMKQQAFGNDALKKMGIKAKDFVEYEGLKTELQPLFKDLFDRINEQRVKLGKRKIAETKDYLTFFERESFFTDAKNLIKGKATDVERTNLILDDLATINQRQAAPIKDSVAFHHLGRRGLDKGIKLDLDPLSIYSRYLNESLRHIHMSPLNAFVKELLTSKLLDVETGKSVRFKNVNPSAAAEIGSWNNKLAGLPNLQLPRTFERLAQRGMNNLTTAQLFGNLRTAVVQSVALFPTAVKFGYTNTAKGIADMAIKRSNAPIKESTSLQNAVMDAAVNDMARVIAGTKMQKIESGAKNLAAKPMVWIDYLAREATFRTAWNNLEGKVKRGEMTKREAIRIADSEVVRTQGSGAVTELSPIQRNVIGKMATLWQTFTINHINFIAKDVLGINDPKANPKQTATRVIRYVGGMLAINALFEHVGGIQSPMPAPVQTLVRGLNEGDRTSAVVLKTVLEVAEAFPFGGSVKFGSSPIGPLAEHAKDIAEALSGNSAYNKNMLDNAINGDEKAMLALAEIIGKTVGVPGTSQTAKYLRGKERGEGNIRAAFGNLGKQSTVSRKKYKRSSRRRSRRR